METFTLEQEKELIRLHRAGDIGARNRLVMSVWPYIFKVALECINATPLWLINRTTPEDLAHAAVARVLDKFDAFDPTKDRKFITYFSILIKRAVWAEATMRSSVVTVKSGWRDDKEAASRAWQTSTMPETWGESTDVEVLVDRSEPGDGVADNEEVAKVLRLVDELPPRTSEVIRRRFFARQTLKAVGAALGICRERVRQIEDEGLAFLREKMVG